MTQTPVLLLIFRRPETTAQVLARIAQAAPRELYVVADGPRPDRPGEADACAAARRVVEQGVTWPCEVRTQYSDANMGLRARVASGITWGLEQTERLIVLEDDCLPDPTFFAYCDELLARYADEPRVMAVSGDNFQRGRRRGSGSYYFSCFPHCWGWATWRRAWARYDADFATWTGDADAETLRTLWPRQADRLYWARLFDAVKRGELDSWATIWTWSCWRHGGLTALSNGNLVTNVGFGVDGTHTLGASEVAALSVQPLAWPLQHPQSIQRDAEADAYSQLTHFRRPLWWRGWRKLLRGMGVR